MKLEHKLRICIIIIIVSSIIIIIISQVMQLAVNRASFTQGRCSGAGQWWSNAMDQTHGCTVTSHQPPPRHPSKLQQRPVLELALTHIPSHTHHTLAQGYHHLDFLPFAEND